MTSPNLMAGRLRRAAGVALGILLLAQLAPGTVSAGPEQTRKELQQARKRVDRIKEELDRVKGQIDDVRAQVADLTAQISQATVQKEALEAAIADTEEARHKAKLKAKRLQVRLDER